MFAAFSLKIPDKNRKGGRKGRDGESGGLELNLDASKRREGEVKKEKERARTKSLASTRFTQQLSKVCVAKNLELSAQSSKRSMPTHERKQTHTQTYCTRHTQTSQCQTKQHTHSLTGSVAFKMDPFVSMSGVFVYLCCFSSFWCSVWQQRKSGRTRFGSGLETRVPAQKRAGSATCQEGRGVCVCVWGGCSVLCQRGTQRGTISHTLPLSSASISVNYSLVSSGIIQTASANVNELLFAYLFFFFVEMSLIIMFYDDECLCWCTLICN